MFNFKIYIQLLFVVLTFLIPIKANSCISLSTAIKSTKSNSKLIITSTEAWQIAFDSKSIDENVCSKKAIKILSEILEYKNVVYDKIISQKDSKKHGHDLKKGFWVIIKSSFKINGLNKNGYGLGASNVSHLEAENKAIKNMLMYNTNWNKDKHGYKIEDKGKF